MDDSINRIAIILPSHLPVPAVCGGAVETIIQNLVEENERDHLFDFTVFSSFDNRAFELSRNYKNTKMVYSKVNASLDDFYNLIYRFFKKIFKVALPDRISRVKMLSNFDSSNYDYILFQAGEVFCLHRYKKKLDAKKMLVHGHGMITPIKSVDPLFSYYISISDFVSDYWKAGSARPLSSYKTWHNCINISKFDRKISEGEKILLRKKLNLEKDDFVVIFTGRIIPEKGVYELIESLKYIRNQNVKIMIIGSAAFEKKTATSYEKKIAEKVRLYKEKVVFTGYIPNEKLYQYYNIADISVIPSKWDEPAGLVVLEAMAAGKPIITTGTGGIREFTNEECALFVSRNGSMPEEIARAVDYMVDNPDVVIKMGKQSQKFANKYSMNRYLHNLKNIILEIQGEKNSC